MKRHPPSYILSLFSSDCYRRTDHAVIRDYISRETTSGRGWWKGSCHTRQWRSFFFLFLPGPPPFFFWCQQLKGIIITSKQTIPEKNNNKKETPYRENRHTEIVSDCRPNNFSEFESEFSKNIFWVYLFNWKTNDGPGKLTSTQIVCFFLANKRNDPGGSYNWIRSN